MDLQSRVTLFMNKVSPTNIGRFVEEARSTDGELAMGLGNSDDNVYRMVANCILTHSVWSGMKRSSAAALTVADVILALDSSASEGAHAAGTPTLTSCVIDSVMLNMLEHFLLAGEGDRENQLLKARECAKGVARLIGQLFKAGLCPFPKFEAILERLSRQNIFASEAAESLLEEEPHVSGLPQCVLLSGRMTKVQPRVGESMGMQLTLFWHDVNFHFRCMDRDFRHQTT